MVAWLSTGSLDPTLYIDRLVQVSTLHYCTRDVFTTNLCLFQPLLTTDLHSLTTCVPRIDFNVHVWPGEMFRWPQKLERGPGGENKTRFLLQNTHSRQPFEVLVETAGQFTLFQVSLRRGKMTRTDE